MIVEDTRPNFDCQNNPECHRPYLLGGEFKGLACLRHYREAMERFPDWQNPRLSEDMLTTRTVNSR